MATHRYGRIVAALFFLSACAAGAIPGQKEAAENKRAEFQLAAAVVSRTQTCFETVLPELRATIAASEGTPSEQEFAAKWHLDRFDPNTAFDDALARCVGAPSLKDLGIREDETPLKFLDRKRGEWQQAEQGGSGDRPSPSNAMKHQGGKNYTGASSK